MPAAVHASPARWPEHGCGTPAAGRCQGVSSSPSTTVEPRPSEADSRASRLGRRSRGDSFVFSGPATPAACNPFFLHSAPEMEAPHHDEASGAPGSCPGESCVPVMMTQHPSGFPGSGKGLQSMYDRQELIGEGRYGRVWRCTDRRTGQSVAMKELPVSTNGVRTRVQREVDIIRALSGHGNIVRLLGVYDDSGDMLKDSNGIHSATVHMVTQFYSSGDLFDLIEGSPGGLGESVAKGIFLQVGHAVRHCHMKGVLHRDIKPENVYLHRYNLPLQSTAGDSIHVPRAKGGATITPGLTAVLGDFGLAVKVPSKDGLVCGRAGSEQYCAPEVDCGIPYLFPADVWSLGVLLCCMLTSNWPMFSDDGVPRPRAAGGWGAFCSLEAADLIKRMLELIPADRPSINEVLRHPWLVKDLQRQGA